jgi:hypothetical protein
VLVNVVGENKADEKAWHTKDHHADYNSLNGFHPIWNTSFVPHMVRNHQLTFIEFTLTEVILI